MRRKSSALIAIAAALICGGRAVAGPQTYLGIQGSVLTGTHTDVAGAQHGAAIGALFEFGAQYKRLSVRIEGIPPVSLPQQPSVTYGQATPQLSLLDGAVRFAVDRDALFWFGAGQTVINQRTPLPNLSQLVTSRLAGVRYEIAYHHAYSPVHFWEIVAGASPHLTGSDHFAYSIPHPAVDKPEVAAEEDGGLTWGIMQHDTEWLFGIRSINFSARFVLTGEAGDRNNGGGVIVEWRRFIDK